jgi:hypothetical protein
VRGGGATDVGIHPAVDANLHFRDRMAGALGDGARGLDAVPRASRARPWRSGRDARSSAGNNTLTLLDNGLILPGTNPILHGA